MNEQQLIIPMQGKQSRIKTNQQTINTYVIRLHEDIGYPDEYSEEFDVINSALPEDTVVLDLCTDGGCMDTAMLFNRALRNTAAHTVAVIGPSCASAGSIIALSCEEFILDDTSSLMIHTSTYGFGRAKDTDIFEHANFSRRQLRKLYEKVYSGYLSEGEIEDVIKGTPFYFDDEQLAERLEMLSMYREDKFSEQLEELKAKGENVQEMKSLDELIADAVESTLHKVLDQRAAKEKKAMQKAQKKQPKIDPVVIENYKEFNEADFNKDVKPQNA